jgi:hypothetical protein
VSGEFGMVEAMRERKALMKERLADENQFLNGFRQRSHCVSSVKSGSGNRLIRLTFRVGIARAGPSRCPLRRCIGEPKR